MAPPDPLWLISCSSRLLGAEQRGCCRPGETAEVTGMAWYGPEVSRSGLFGVPTWGVPVPEWVGCELLRKALPNIVTVDSAASQLALGKLGCLSGPQLSCL